jgi:hypothetical protein
MVLGFRYLGLKKRTQLDYLREQNDSLQKILKDVE